MFKKTTLSVILLSIFSVNIASYAASDSEIKLQKDYPDSYLVKEGDTLWGISGRFLQDPIQWPQIWNMNREKIKNPDLIYPGDVVYMDNSGKNPRLRLMPSKTIMLNPTVLIEPLKRIPIPAISPAVIGPFLSQPLLVEGKDFEASPEIIGTANDQFVITAGNQAYAVGMPKESGYDWRVYRAGKDLVDPETNKSLGIEAIYLGDATLLKNGNPSTIQINRANQEITAHDKLVKTPDEAISRFIPHAPLSIIQATVVSSYNGVSELGAGMIMSINRGSDDGLEDGNVLNTYTAGKVLVDSKSHAKTVNNEDLKKSKGQVLIAEGSIKMPDEYTGKVMVFRTFKHLSYCLVMKTSVPIHVGDLLKTPAVSE